MDYFVTFLEGIISFISPCTLPMLPVYISYLTGGQNSETKQKNSLLRPLGFVLGFTAVFSLLGMFAGAVSSLLTRHQTVVNIVSGGIVILFGLSYLDVIQLKCFKGMQRQREVHSFLSAFVFGMVYSVSLTPCVGAFLGSAIMLAAGSGTAAKGTLLLLLYSLGLGLPFLLSALMLDKLTATFQKIKQHYKVINLVCGIFLIAVGLLMAFGVLNKLIAILS